MLLVVFFAGCAAERLLVVPPARAGTNPQRWEYACRGLPVEARPVEEAANKLGAEGWEMTGSSESTWCFKRSLP
jgi:hypothetical protein